MTPRTQSPQGGISPFHLRRSGIACTDIITVFSRYMKQPLLTLCDPYSGSHRRTQALAFDHRRTNPPTHTDTHTHRLLPPFYLEETSVARPVDIDAALRVGTSPSRLSWPEMGLSTRQPTSSLQVRAPTLVATAPPRLDTTLGLSSPTRERLPLGIAPQLVANMSAMSSNGAEPATAGLHSGSV